MRRVRTEPEACSRATRGRSTPSTFSPASRSDAHGAGAAALRRRDGGRTFGSFAVRLRHGRPGLVIRGRLHGRQDTSAAHRAARQAVRWQPQPSHRRGAARHQATPRLGSRQRSQPSSRRAGRSRRSSPRWCSTGGRARTTRTRVFSTAWDSRWHLSPATRPTSRASGAGGGYLVTRLSDRLRQDAADRLKAVTPLPARRALVKARLATRTRTARFRLLPDVLIIGAQRSGTSSLYKYLGRHPNVAPSLRKEIEFFSVDYPKGEEWYRAHFPLTARRWLARAVRRPFVTFEATPDYLFDPRSPRRAHTLVPDARLVAMLREPAERAVSHYHHSVRNGLEDLDIETAFRMRTSGSHGEVERALADPAYPALALRRFSYSARGRYAEQIERWLEHYPRSQCWSCGAPTSSRIRRRRSIVSSSSSACRAGIRPSSATTATSTHWTATTRTPPASVRDYLRQQFEEPNERLVALLGEEFRWDAQARSLKSAVRTASKVRLRSRGPFFGGFPGPRILIYHQVDAGLGRQMEVTKDAFIAQLDWMDRAWGRR